MYSYLIITQLRIIREKKFCKIMKNNMLINKVKAKAIPVTGRGGL
jgi:hypothetical protein